MYRNQVAAIAVLLSISMSAAALSPGEWRADIRQLAELVENSHPDAYTKISRDEFQARVSNLLDTVERMSDAQVSVSMMALIASIDDGHSTLHPIDPAGFNHWLPLAFYWFEDGIFIVSTHPDYKTLLGRQVMAINDRPLSDVLPHVTALMGSDNSSGNRQNIFYLGSADALQALGIIDEFEEVRLTVMDGSGACDEIHVKSVESEFILDDSMFWGEMFAPVTDDYLDDFVVPFNDMSIAEYLKSTPQQKQDLPLHYRNRRAYWSEYLPEESIYYMQINHITSGGRGEYESFEQFYDEAFEFLEKNPADKFVLDIRYNSGGDGSILIPFVHKFIRNDKVNRPGHLFTVVGRKTYSAATILLDLMLKHTNTVLVGEPAGSALNGYGDPREYVLQFSRMKLNLSSEYWKLVHTSESPRLTPIDIPAVFSSADYFSGNDPAIRSIKKLGGPYQSLDKVLSENGGQAARHRYDQEKSVGGKYSWWRPFDESTFRKVARAQTEAENFADGIAGFEILIDAYPDSWRAWRDFGIARIKQGQDAEAIRCLIRAQQLNPGDSEINSLLEEMR